MLLVDFGMFGVWVEVLYNLSKYTLNLGGGCFFLCMSFMDPNLFPIFLGFDIIIFISLFVAEVGCAATLKTASK